MHQKVSNLIFDFNFIKILFPKFKFPQNAKLITFLLFKNMQNLGCYMWVSTAADDVRKEGVVLCLGGMSSVWLLR